MFQKAVQLDANADTAYIWLSMAYAEDHQTAKARQAIQTALTLNPQRKFALYAQRQGVK